jgi:AcrR family transcriptional regulator
MSGRAERARDTRAALVRAGRKLFAERGYAAVGTEELVARAGVTRGALYHHFRDKRDLFRAVYEQLEQEAVEASARDMAGIEDPVELLRGGVRSYLDACLDPAMRQIALLDAPAVLGWEEWREIGSRYALGLVVFGLQNAMDRGALRQADVKPLAHIMLGALGEAAMLIANSPDPAATRQEVEGPLLTLLDGLRA